MAFLFLHTLYHLLVAGRHAHRQRTGCLPEQWTRAPGTAWSQYDPGSGGGKHF